MRVGEQRQDRYQLAPSRGRDGRAESLTLSWDFSQYTSRQVSVAVGPQGLPGTVTEDVVVRKTARIAEPPRNGRLRTVPPSPGRRVAASRAGVR